MVDFARLQAAVKERLEEDLAIKSIEVEGSTLETAMSNASTLLGMPVRNLEYEIIFRQTSFLGVGKDIFKIRAYENPNKKFKSGEAAHAGEELADVASELELIEDRDGETFVQLRYDGVYLKVTPPIGDGVAAEIHDAEAALTARRIKDVDKTILKSLINHADGEYFKVGTFTHAPLNDSIVDIEISDQEMRAFITVRPPREFGCDFSFEDYKQFLNNNMVTYGVNEQFLQNFADKPIYDQKVCVATGTKAIDGLHSYVEYFFETDQNKVRLRENSDGKVDFKELNIIQNVFKDEKLATIHAAEKGQRGYTVTGKMLEAKDGKDFSLTIGKNVHFAEDGQTVVSDVNGQVVMSNGKINVEIVYTVDGSVNLKTGNIIFLGNVVVTGNVEEGFSVKASGNIEVYGTVDKASLDAEGDIIVRQGITGKEGTAVNAGRSIWVKFIENARVSAGGMIVVSDGILNSQVSAAKRIVCQGKRAAIIGGRQRAAESISAKSLGSPSGNTETICEVGYDPKSKAQLEMFSGKLKEVQLEFDDVQLNIRSLESIRQQRGSLPDEKEEYYQQLIEKRKELVGQSNELTASIEKVNKVLSDLKFIGRVSASQKVNPGVVIIIRNEREVIRNEYKAVTFAMENNMIRAEKYYETDIDVQNRSSE
ncbi:polymerase [Spirochaetia bacterium]|nr:polymerase [Spirochaetia bacterium]